MINFAVKKNCLKPDSHTEKKKTVFSRHPGVSRPFQIIMGLVQKVRRPGVSKLEGVSIRDILEISRHPDTSNVRQRVSV